MIFTHQGQGQQSAPIFKRSLSSYFIFYGRRLFLVDEYDRSSQSPHSVHPRGRGRMRFLKTSVRSSAHLRSAAETRGAKLQFSSAFGILRNRVNCDLCAHAPRSVVRGRPRQRADSNPQPPRATHPRVLLPWRRPHCCRREAGHAADPEFESQAGTHGFRKG